MENKLRHLSNFYKSLNDANYKTWLNFRDEYMGIFLEENGMLVCSYCGKENLDKGIKGNSLDNNLNTNLATIDHIIPLSKGGPKYEIENLTIACKSCNSRKDNKNLEDFINGKH